MKIKLTDLSPFPAKNDSKCATGWNKKRSSSRGENAGFAVPVAGRVWWIMASITHPILARHPTPRRTGADILSQARGYNSRTIPCCRRRTRVAYCNGRTVIGRFKLANSRFGRITIRCHNPITRDPIFRCTPSVAVRSFPIGSQLVGTRSRPRRSRAFWHHNRTMTTSGGSDGPVKIWLSATDNADS